MSSPLDIIMMYVIIHVSAFRYMLTLKPLPGQTDAEELHKSGQVVQEPVMLSATDAALIIGMLAEVNNRYDDAAKWAVDVLRYGSESFREAT